MKFTRLVIYPYRIDSDGAHDLKDYLKELGHKCFLAYPDKAYVPAAGDVVIGWGMSKVPKWASHIAKAELALNSWEKVKAAIGKDVTLAVLQDAGVPCVDFTASASTARQWASQGVVFGRTMLRASRGKGIEIFRSPSDVLPCKLYTKGEKNLAEYRVYVIGDTVVDVLEKRKSASAKQHNEFVRSEEGGWVFCRQHVHINPSEAAAAVKAVKALSLDFGGVDLIRTNHGPKILEVNTAPGIFGSGVKNFGNGLLAYIKNR